MEAGSRWWSISRRRRGPSSAKPRGVVHAAWNKGAEPASFLEVIAPSGFESFFVEVADMFSGPAEPPRRCATTDNEKLVRRLVGESVNANRSDLLARTVAPDVRIHPATPGAAPDTEGIDDLTVAFESIHAAFPDLHVTVDDVIAAGDRVAARWTATGTHRGELAGIAATGRSVRWSGIDVYRLDQGKVVEWWRNDDVTGLLHQLGGDP